MRKLCDGLKGREHLVLQRWPIQEAPSSRPAICSRKFGQDARHRRLWRRHGWTWPKYVAFRRASPTSPCRRRCPTTASAARSRVTLDGKRRGGGESCPPPCPSRGHRQKNLPGRAGNPLAGGRGRPRRQADRRGGLETGLQRRRPAGGRLRGAAVGRDGVQFIAARSAMEGLRQLGTSLCSTHRHGRLRLLAPGSAAST